MLERHLTFPPAVHVQGGPHCPLSAGSLLSLPPAWINHRLDSTTQQTFRLPWQHHNLMQALFHDSYRLPFFGLRPFHSNFCLCFIYPPTPAPCVRACVCALCLASWCTLVTIAIGRQRGKKIAGLRSAWAAQPEPVKTETNKPLCTCFFLMMAQAITSEKQPDDSG